MKKTRIEDNLWKYIFPVLSAVLWVLTAVLYFKMNSSYHTNDFEAQQAILNASRWHPACCIGAVISTAAAWVVSDLQRIIDKNTKQ